MRPWLIPTGYVALSVVLGFTLPRVENAYLRSFTLSLSIASTQAFLSAAASGMMALTAVVFAIGIVMVQFSASAYSPRLANLFVRDRTLFHSLGMFSATFIYALSTLAWVDRAGGGTAPLFSSLLVMVLVVASMVLFALLMQRLNDLQITNVLHMIGDRGREVIREMFDRLDKRRGREITGKVQLGPVSQTLKYAGKPRTIAALDVNALSEHAEKAGGVIALACAVGDTLVDNTLLLQIHGAAEQVAEERLSRAIHLETERTFEQDPKFPIRLLVDIAIRALSPAINDPTTAVQAIDQIEDLLVRLARHDLDAGYISDGNGALRLILLMPTWEDYLTLAFDEIRQFGAGSIQVMRRLRSALIGVAGLSTNPERADAVRRYLKHLDLAIARSPLDEEDQAMARQEDRQGLGLTRRRVD